MIGVKIHGTNYIHLKGDCLSDRTNSAVIIQPGGFTIRVCVSRYGVHELTNLRREQVIPAISDELTNCHQEEDINEPEIERYVGLLQSFADARPEMFPKPVMVKGWAICQYYEPFTMGGNVWQWRRFEIDAEDVELVKGFKGFVFYDDLTREYRVHEITTGGLLGEGKLRDEAVATANKNIEETPDLKNQMANLGDTSNFQVVEAADALRRIAKKRNQ